MDAAVQGLGMTTLQSRQGTDRVARPAAPDEEACPGARWRESGPRGTRSSRGTSAGWWCRCSRGASGWTGRGSWRRRRGRGSVQQQQRGLLTELSLPYLALTQAAFLASDDARRTRRESVDGTVEDLPERQQPVDPAQSAEKRLLSEEQLARARDALEQVSPGARNVFLLACDGQGLPHAEVASRVGLSVQRVRQILCEVRKKLRTALEEEKP
ncbi:RNA polymerase sigma factor [Corallococcus sp. 4LFB]|uniref:RNA polymerase sigma factor n=1 Tax=Corallococcus sp. 4LFB TaxID=3383249 RepID=UPI0039760DA4